MLHSQRVKQMDSTILFGTISSAAILIVLLVLYATIKPSTANTNMVPTVAAFPSVQTTSDQSQQILPDLNTNVENAPQVTEIQTESVHNVPVANVMAASIDNSIVENTSEAQVEEKKVAETEAQQHEEEIAVPSAITPVETPAPIDISPPPTSFALPTDVSALSNATSAQDLVSEATSVKKWNYGYCVKCKSKKQMRDPFPIVMKNGRNAVRGLCPDCDTKIFKIGSMAQ